MRYFLIFFNLTFYHFSYSQQSTTDTINQSGGDFASIEIIYGNHLYNNQINNQFNSISSFDFSQPIQSIGISFTNGYVINRKRESTLHISYSQIVPKDIVINDTLTSRINGFIFSVNIFSYDITSKLKSISTPIGLGFNTGRLKIQADSYKSQKNPFFAPTIFLNPRFLIGKVMIGIRCDYQFDISKTGWRSVTESKNELSFPVNNLNQTGLSFNLSLGWKIFDY